MTKFVKKQKNDNINNTVIINDINEFYSTDDNFPYFTEDELSERAYNFHFVLYPDSESYSADFTLALVQHLGETGKIEKYAYILHDQDGEDIKLHYHLCVSFKNQKSLKTVLDMLNIHNYKTTEGMPEIRHWKDMLQYIIHNTKECHKKGKYQYPTSRVISNFDNEIKELRYSKDLDMCFLEIVDYIKEYGNYITMSKLIDYCRKEEAYLKCLTSKKYNFMITQLIKERNMNYL